VVPAKNAMGEAGIALGGEKSAIGAGSRFETANVSVGEVKSAWCCGWCCIEGGE